MPLPARTDNRLASLPAGRHITNGASEGSDSFREAIQHQRSIRRPVCGCVALPIGRPGSSLAIGTTLSAQLPEDTAP
jgi:hypothetical protein